MNDRSRQLLEEVQAVQFNRPYRSSVSDSNKQHRIQLKLMEKGEVNEKVETWIYDPTSADIIGIDDVSKDRITEARYGNVHTRSERKLLGRIRKINAARPTNELKKDLSSNEPLRSLYDWRQWEHDKIQYDVDTVDTIPKHQAGYSSNEIRKAVLKDVKRQKYNRGMSINRWGYYAPGFTKKTNKQRNYVRVNKLLKGSPNSQPTLAHEIGHAVDYNLFGDLRKSGSGNLVASDPVYKEMREFALEYDPIPTGASQSFISYRHSRGELFADAFAGFIQDPRKAEKKYPKFYRYLATKDKRLPILAKKTKSDFLNSFVAGLKRKL